MKTLAKLLCALALIASVPAFAGDDAKVDDTRPTSRVPEAATTVVLLAASLAGVEFVRRKLAR